MDNIRVGLDFGTHQTKICVQRIPDEGHGEPIYEFFKFRDLKGNEQYFLPSLVQINEDNTLSYGYVDTTKEKDSTNKPILKSFEIRENNTDVAEEADKLYDKYASSINTPEHMYILAEMLNIKNRKLSVKQKIEALKAKEEYEQQIQSYRKKQNHFRYFKQALFSERTWDKKVDCKTLSIWYLSYVIFLLEEEYGQNFSINIGIPADDNTFETKKRLAVEVLLSAYNLVENVYENDKEKFLCETIDVLREKTEYKNYSKEEKEEFIINVFPEAYAGLITLTSKGKISTGMSLTADIGGGTTDISFFTIQKDQPAIYRYWSIPRGLNYIAEKSGFDYAEGNFTSDVDAYAVDLFNRKKMEVVSILIKDLTRQLRDETNIPVSNLILALKNRVLVYNGGGSTYSFLTKSILDFSDVKLIDSSMWKEENIIDKSEVSPLCQLLTTAYGLSIGENDEDVKLCKFTSLFDGLPKKGDNQEYNFVDKDQC